MKKLLLAIAIILPLRAGAMTYENAVELKRAGFPQLQGSYWKNTKSGPVQATYRGAKPAKTWFYQPTAEEIAARLEGPLVIARDYNTAWTALQDAGWGDGNTLADALARLYLDR